jgi:hypothetical protein
VDDAVGLAVDDMDRRLAKVQPSHEPHRRGQRVELRWGRLLAGRPAAQDAVGAAQSLRDRRDRGTVAVAEDQGREQLIAEVVRVAQFGPVLLAVMGVEMELGPVMNDQGIVEAIVPDPIACRLDQGPGQLRPRDPVVGVEPPSGLGTGEGLGGAR